MEVKQKLFPYPEGFSYRYKGLCVFLIKNKGEYRALVTEYRVKGLFPEYHVYRPLYKRLVEQGYHYRVENFDFTLHLHYSFPIPKELYELTGEVVDIYGLKVAEVKDKLLELVPVALITAVIGGFMALISLSN